MMRVEKEKAPLGDCNCEGEAPRSTGSQLGRKRKSPVRGLQRPLLLPGGMKTPAGVEKEKAPLGDCNSFDPSSWGWRTPSGRKRKSPVRGLQPSRRGYTCGFARPGRKRKSPVRGLQRGRIGPEDSLLRVYRRKRKSPVRGLQPSVAMDSGTIRPAVSCHARYAACSDGAL